MPMFAFDHCHVKDGVYRESKLDLCLKASVTLKERHNRGKGMSVVCNKVHLIILDSVASPATAQPYVLT